MKYSINGIPNVCANLQDQSQCPKAVELCGANSSEAACTAKLIGLDFANYDQYVNLAHVTMEAVLRIFVASGAGLVELLTRFNPSSWVNWMPQL